MSDNKMVNKLQDGQVSSEQQTRQESQNHKTLSQDILAKSWGSTTSQTVSPAQLIGATGGIFIKPEASSDASSTSVQVSNQSSPSKDTGKK